MSHHHKHDHQNKCCHEHSDTHSVSHNDLNNEHSECCHEHHSGHCHSGQGDPHSHEHQHQYSHEHGDTGEHSHSYSHTHPHKHGDEHASHDHEHDHFLEHSHNHHDQHQDKSLPDKLRILIPHWVEHNRAHILEYKKWEEKAKSEGLTNVECILNKISEKLEELDKLYKKIDSSIP